MQLLVSEWAMFVWFWVLDGCYRVELKFNNDSDRKSIFMFFFLIRKLFQFSFNINEIHARCIITFINFNFRKVCSVVIVNGSLKKISKKPYMYMAFFDIFIYYFFCNNYEFAKVYFGEFIVITIFILELTNSGMV